MYDQYISMLKFYMKREKPKPSWLDVVLALQSPFVDCQDLRQTNLPQKVLGKFEAGQLKSVRQGKRSIPQYVKYHDGFCAEHSSSHSYV